MALRLGRLAVGLWLLLILASAFTQRLAAPEAALAEDQSVLALGAPAPARIAYRDFGPRDGDVLVLIHGTAQDAHALSPIARALAKTRRVLLPDLPGYGASTPAADLAATASRLDRWLSQLDVSAVTVVGHDLGAVVGAQLYELRPASITAWIAVAPAGPSQLEGLADPHLNRALAGLSLTAVQLLRWGLPHFGLLDAPLLGLAHRTQHYDQSLDDLEARLRAITVPALVIRVEDGEVFEAARANEYHRRIAQSELALHPGRLLQQPDAIAERITAFDDRARRGDAPALADATAQRRSLASAAFAWHDAPRPQGTALLVLLLVLVLATYVSEDLTCIAAGLLVARGTLAFLPATAACMIGIFTSDLALYFLGRHFGRPALERRPLRWLITPSQLARSEAWFSRRGPWAIIASRFVPGSRVPCYVSAGLLRMPFWRFAGWFFAAALVWTPILVGLAWTLGDSLTDALGRWQRWGLVVLLLSGLGLFLLVRLVSAMATRRGRRLLYGRWQRLHRWEFWPPWVFYPPLLVYICFLGIRFRGLTVFTAANPAIPASGFVGESKLDILTGLGFDHPHALATALVPEGDQATRLAFVERFRDEHALQYPLVLKPDAGERGRHVAIVRSAVAAADYLAKHPQGTLVQAYAPGQEFGVFYYRHPGATQGQVLAVTDKRPVSVIGDGRCTLEELILNHPRAVCMAPHFLRVHASQLDRVLDAGEVLALVEVGTHCLGCVFLDGAAVLTPELIKAIDDLSQRYEGFYFGRYDIRTPSVDDFRAGRNFKVVELNGVTSEATSIYDPGNSLWHAYGVLMHQWRLAFEIGAANRARGALPTDALALLRLLRDTAG